MCIPWRPTSAVALLMLAAGCARNERSHANHYESAPRPSVRKLVVLIDARNEYGASKNQIRDSVRRAVPPGPEAVYPVRTAAAGKRDDGERAADEAIRIARAQGADTACVVDVGECGGMFMIYALPPVWGLNNRLVYSVRAFDVASGRLLLETNRTRHNGGMLAVSVPRLLPQLERGVRADLKPLWVASASNAASPSESATEPSSKQPTERQ